MIMAVVNKSDSVTGASRRFAHFSPDEIEKKKSASVPINTKRANEKAARALRAYLLECDGGCGRFNFEDFTTAELDSALEGFWFSARNANGGKYRASSLDNLRHGLGRYLKAPPFNRSFDIIRDREFQASNEAFKGALRELKQEGKADVKHYPEIVDADLKLLYSQFICDNPISLQEKVQFDIRFYFFRRGSENMHRMTKSTFVLLTNPESGERYIRLAEDELTKNHQGDCRERHTPVMPEKVGDKNCPVSSYLKYVSHLNPKCDALWARPLPSKLTTPTTGMIDGDREEANEVWYCKVPIGKSMLAKFMKELSVKYKLSQVYTNHSIRVTGATILTRKSYAASQIKAVTGHRSVSSLAIYQKVSEGEKIQMGQTLGQSVGRNEERIPPSLKSPYQQKEYRPTPVSSFNASYNTASLGFPPENMMVPQICKAPSTWSRPPNLPVASRPTPDAANSLDLHDTPKPTSPLLTISSQDLRDICQSQDLFSDENVIPTTPLQQTVRTNQSSVPPSPVGTRLQPIDFDLSPLLRDLANDPYFEETTECSQVTVTQNTGYAGQVVELERRHVNVRHASPRRQTLPTFSGCTIHNLVINVHKK